MKDVMNPEKEIPGRLEYFKGKLLPVVNASRSGWWRFHEHYDRDGYIESDGCGGNALVQRLRSLTND